MQITYFEAPAASLTSFKLYCYTFGLL